MTKCCEPSQTAITFSFKMTSVLLITIASKYNMFHSIFLSFFCFLCIVEENVELEKWNWKKIWMLAFHMLELKSKSLLNPHIHNYNEVYYSRGLYVCNDSSSSWQIQISRNLHFWRNVAFVWSIWSPQGILSRKKNSLTWKQWTYEVNLDSPENKCIRIFIIFEFCVMWTCEQYRFWTNILWFSKNAFHVDSRLDSWYFSQDVKKCNINANDSMN